MMFVCQILLPLTLGLQAEAERMRFPTLSPGSIGRTARAIQALLRRGLQPAVAKGPFGNTVLGTADQDLPLLAEEAAFRRINAEVLQELLLEDPLLFIRNLPVGDPRRIAVGIDSPATAGRPAPAFPTTSALRVATTPARRVVPRARSPFSIRAALGRFAVR